MHRVIVAMAAMATVMTLGGALALADEPKDQQPPPPQQEKKADRDCTPINGPFGYYGNPWCDTGSYRQEDIEFRERRARERRQNGGGQ